MSRDEIADIVAAFGDLARAIELADKADIYQKLRLSLACQPGEKLVEATIQPDLNMRKGFVSEAGVLPIGYGSEVFLTSTFVMGGVAFRGSL